MRSPAVSASVPSRSKTRVGCGHVRRGMRSSRSRNPARRRQARRRGAPARFLRARPSAPVSTATPHSVAAPSAGSKRPEGILRVKRRIGSSLSMPITEFVVAGHADVGDVAGAAGKDARVGRRRMGVGADDEAGAAVDVMAERLFLARRLGVEIEDRDVAAVPAGRRRAPRRCAERVVERVHEHAPHQIDDEHPRAARGLEQVGAAPGRAGGVVGGADQARLALDETSASRWSKAWLPSVIASAPAARNSSQIASVMPKPPAAFSPLTTTKSSRQRARNSGRRFEQRGAPGAPDDVADEQQPHQPRPRASISSRSVRTKSSGSSCGSSGAASTSQTRIGDADGADRRRWRADASARGRNGRRRSRCDGRGDRRRRAARTADRDRPSGPPAPGRACASRPELSARPAASGGRRAAPAAAVDGQRGREAVRRKRGEQRQRVGLVADRREGGDDSRAASAAPHSRPTPASRAPGGAGRRIDGAAAGDAPAAQFAT